MHHDLDIHPIPEKVLYINELGIADTAFCYNTEEQHQKALTGRTRTNGGILAVRIEEHLHSKKGIELADKIIGVLLEDEGCAERFPYDVVDKLKKEFGI